MSKNELKSLLKKYKNLDRTITEKNEIEIKNEEKIEKNDEKRNKIERKEVVNFLIIGVQKAGTTSIVKNLNKHSNIFVKNECQFFTFCWSFGLSWYRDQLQSNKQIIGEKTPEIIYCDDCAVRVKEVCPNAKFILCLRDPIKRLD